MSDTVKTIISCLFIAIFIIWCYAAYKETKKRNEEESKALFEALRKYEEDLNDVSLGNWRDITEDSEAILSDWERVGEYLRYAMKEMDKELADKDKEK